jgi:hypothetical protein
VAAGTVKRPAIQVNLRQSGERSAWVAGCGKISKTDGSGPTFAVGSSTNVFI